MMDQARTATGDLPIASPPAVVRDLGIEDLRASLAAGWRDMCRAPGYAVLLSGGCVLGGWLLIWALTVTGQIWWTIPISLGFPLLGPFIAVGFYEISRRLEAGLPLSPGAILGVVWRQKDRQIPSVAAVVVVFFLFWNFLSHMIFALFMGLQVMTNVSSSLAVFMTPHGLMMMGMQVVIGGGFAATLYMLSVVALPMLLDREVDYVTAMLTSKRVVERNPKVMWTWAALIAGMVLLAMLPAFLGLLVVLPWLGHSSWHLYRRALAPLA